MIGISVWKSESGELDAALLRAQAKFQPAKRSGFSNEWGKPYSTISDYLAVVTGPLNEEGLLLQQPAFSTPDGVVVQTRLIHVASGQGLATDLEYPTKDSVLDKSGAIALARRDGLRSLLGLQSDDEDGGSSPKLTLDPSIRVVARSPAPASAIMVRKDPVSDLEVKRLRSDCARLSDLATIATGKTRAELKESAGIPEGPLDAENLQRYRAWLIQTIDIAGGALPDWANDPIEPRPADDEPPPPIET